MARYLDSKYGKIKPYKGNPRKISDGSFTKLCASIDRDPEFMQARPIIIDENNAILGGNQRQFAILSLLEGGWSLEGEEMIRLYGWECVFDGKLPDDWVRRLLKPKGMSAEDWEVKKQRFVLIDNSPEGMAGEFDYEIMGENFSPDVMADAGIDFANTTYFLWAANREGREPRHGDPGRRLPVRRGKGGDIRVRGKAGEAGDLQGAPGKGACEPGGDDGRPVLLLRDLPEPRAGEGGPRRHIPAE